MFMKYAVTVWTPQVNRDEADDQREDGDHLEVQQ
jgi:hypothetical protein